MSFIVILTLLFAHAYLAFIAVNVFLFYRLYTISDPLSVPALRGDVLTPEWQKYFRCALVVSCLLLLYHGLFALLMMYVSELFVVAWLLGSFLTSCCPLCFNLTAFTRSDFVVKLPDSVFENGVIDYEAILRIRKEMRRLRTPASDDGVQEKDETEMWQLSEDLDFSICFVFRQPNR